MNIFVNNELVVLRGEEDILDYVEDNLGNDVRKAVEEPIRKAEKCVETVEYERDIAWDGIRNLEEAESIFQPTMDRNYFSTLYYLILSLENKYQETLDLTFKENRNKYISSVIKQENAAIKAGFDMTKFHKKLTNQ